MRRSRTAAFVPSTGAWPLVPSRAVRRTSRPPARCLVDPSSASPGTRGRGGSGPSRAFQCAGAALAGALAATVVTAGSDAALAYGLVNGRLEKCRGDIPCISTTSVGNPSKFGPPWSYQPQTSDPDAAWAALKRAVEANRDKGRIVEVLDGPEEYYLRAEFPSSFKGTDDVEFRLMKKDALVTYRSASREALFVYPLQTPLNTDKNRTRLLDIRQALGWEEFAGFNVFGTTFQ